jgi:hypothetical protein
LFARDQSKNKKRERKNKKSRGTFESDGGHLRQISENDEIIIESFTTISGAKFISTLFSLVVFLGTHMVS